MANTDEVRFPEASYEDWRAEVERGLKGADFDKKLVTRTLEGIDVQPLYSARDWPAGEDQAGFPGAPPFRRGALAVGRHAAARDMRPRFDRSDIDGVRREIAAELARGARSLWLCFDAGARGLEPSAASGIAVRDAAELALLLDRVPLDRVALSLDAGANALPFAASLVHLARARGFELATLEAWLNADPLAALARDGALACSLDAARQQLGELAGFLASAAPRMRGATVSTAPYHDAGAHAAQEIAFALATGVAYLRWLEQAGLAPGAAATQLAFSFAIGGDAFMEIAKLRAFRQCWAQILAASGCAANDQTCAIHAQTSTRSKTGRDPWVNMLRETGEAFAAAVGGADAITTQGFDRTLGVSDEFARRIASNVQVILDEEAHVTRVADPAGGAWYVESLTDRLAELGWRGFQAIEARGGMRTALESGYVAGEIAATASARADQLRKRKRAITGVSEFANVDEPRVTRPRPALPERGPVTVASDDARLQPVIAANRRRQGLFDAVLAAAAGGVEFDALTRAIAGSAPPARITAIAPMRDAAEFERLRDACDAQLRASGKRPTVFLCNLGPIPQHKPRSQFATSFFNAGGFAVADNDGFEEPERAARAFDASGAQLCALCGSDAAYTTAVEAFAPALRAAGAKRIALAGRAGEQEARYRSAGVTDFVFQGCDAIAALEQLLAAIGVTP